MNSPSKGEMPIVRWIRLPPDSPPKLPKIGFYGLLSPFLYMRGVGISWSDPGKDSILERYLRRLLLEGALDGVSATQLARATGVPTKYWQLALLALERAGLLKMGAVVRDDLDRSEFTLIAPVSNDNADELEGRLSEILRRSRAVRDVLVFPETNDLLITSGGVSNASDHFISGFADPRSDWLRTNLSIASSKFTLRQYLDEIATTTPPIGIARGLTQIKFETNAEKPPLVPVKALAGIVCIDGGSLIPQFTNFQPPHTNGPGNPAMAKKRTTPPHLFSLNHIDGLASLIRERLNVCSSDAVLASARAAAPADRPEYGTLQTAGFHSWQIQSTSSAAHSLDIAFSDIKFRLAISSVAIRTTA